MPGPLATTAVALTVAASLVVAGCSSDDDGSAHDRWCEQIDRISTDIDELVSTPRDELSGDSVRDRLEEIQTDITEAREAREEAPSDRWTQVVDAADDVEDRLADLADRTPLPELGDDASRAIDELRDSWSETVAAADCDPET